VFAVPIRVFATGRSRCSRWSDLRVHDESDPVFTMRRSGCSRSAGACSKITNCQIGVSLSSATATEHLPIDFELYLPRKWTDRPDLRAEARILEDIVFRTKLELALTMIDRALADCLPRGIVLADSAYGDSSDFRAELRRRKLHHAVGVDATTNVCQLDKDGTPRGDPVSVRDLALRFWARPNAYPSKPFRRFVSVRRVAS
jgi:SRSO17 transposase